MSKSKIYLFISLSIILMSTNLISFSFEKNYGVIHSNHFNIVMVGNHINSAILICRPFISLNVTDYVYEKDGDSVFFNRRCYLKINVENLKPNDLLIFYASGRGSLFVYDKNMVLQGKHSFNGHTNNFEWFNITIHNGSNIFYIKVHGISIIDYITFEKHDLCWHVNGVPIYKFYININYYISDENNDEVYVEVLSNSSSESDFNIMYYDYFKAYTNKYLIWKSRYIEIPNSDFFNSTIINVYLYFQFKIIAKSFMENYVYQISNILNENYTMVWY